MLLERKNPAGINSFSCPRSTPWKAVSSSYKTGGLLELRLAKSQGFCGPLVYFGLALFFSEKLEVIFWLFLKWVVSVRLQTQMGFTFCFKENTANLRSLQDHQQIV